MDNVCYNIYSISDSDDDLALVENSINVSLNKNKQFSSPEPEFFQQVFLNKKKKLLSPKKTKHNIRGTCHVEKDVHENKKQRSIEDYGSYINESNATKNNKHSTEMVEPKRKKRLTREEIEEKKKEEITKKYVKENLKRINPKECMKYITIHIDNKLQNYDYSEQIFSEIKSTDAQYIIESNSIVSHSITWSRQTSDTLSESEDFMLLIWDFDYIKNLITSNDLLKKINNLKSYKTQLSIIIFSTTDQLKITTSKKNKFSKSDVLNNLQQMMLICGVSFRFVVNKIDIALAIVSFTNSIANKPYKLKKYLEEKEGCDWYASGHKKNCISVNKNGTGLSELWRQQLSQFPLCTLEISEAISSVYSSPVALLEAYDECGLRSEGELLLQDIPVRRGFGPLAANRRIGPELSKKIYTFFTDNTGCTTLSQE